MRQLNKLHLLHRIYLQRAAVNNGLYNGQPPLLEYVEKHPGCTQAELADFLKVSPPCIATSVKRLQKAGIITKTEDASDMRRSHLYLTPLGQTKSEQCRQAADQIDKQIFNGFTSEETECFYSMLDRMLANLSIDEFAGKSFGALMQTAKELEKKEPEQN
ncbi:MAG: hypothetical protein DBY09_03545 [Selenomonadales bacterium]|jgi:transcriptional regulator, MarR family|nr:winged helix-turn-helix transcriptional regulator [Clostridiales bacterium]PWL99899.1 MAG: hypothetical protein DBY09_03545 [Selenomonadales bacterium]